MYKHHLQIVKDVGYSLLDIFVKFAFFMMMTIRKNKFSTVINAVYVELEAVRILFIVTNAIVAWLFN